MHIDEETRAYSSTTTATSTMIVLLLATISDYTSMYVAIS